MYDNPLSGRIANSIVQLMVISGNYRWLLGLRPRPHQGGCSSPLDPRLLPGSMLRIDMAWPPGKYRFQRPLLKSSSGSKGCCGTGFRTLLTHLVQHVASGSGGLASAAALSQTCKSFYAVSESSAVTYRNLHIEKPLFSLDHPFFPWLAKRHSRIAGLTAELQLLTVGNLEPEPKQLQVMFSIPGLHLIVCCNEVISTPGDPFLTKVLRPHGHLIDHLISFVSITGEGLELQDFCEAAARCRSLDLTVRGSSEVPLNMAALGPVAGSLVELGLNLEPSSPEMESVSSLSLLSRLTSLSLGFPTFSAEEPWNHLVGLTNLKQLTLWVAASGDPSPLSALTGLSALDLHSYGRPLMQGGLSPPCTFSSLQPLSTLQQLVKLELCIEACSATSLHGLAELTSLETLRLHAPMLEGLEGMSTGLTSLYIYKAPQLHSLAGIGQLHGLQDLSVLSSGVTCLHPLAALGSLEDLCIGGTFASLGDGKVKCGAVVRKGRVYGRFGQFRRPWGSKHQCVCLPKSSAVGRMCLPILLFGSETWALAEEQSLGPISKKQSLTLKHVDTRCCRSMRGVKLSYWHSSAHVRSVRGIAPLGAIITNSRLRWLGHVAPMEPVRKPCCIFIIVWGPRSTKHW